MNVKAYFSWGGSWRLRQYKNCIIDDVPDKSGTFLLTKDLFKQPIYKQPEVVGSDKKF